MVIVYLRNVIFRVSVLMMTVNIACLISASIVFDESHHNIYYQIMICHSIVCELCNGVQVTRYMM